MANQDNPVLRPISKNQLRRLPVYLTFLKEIKDQGEEFISAQKIAKTLNLSEEQVRKDLALISSIEGIPRLGRKIEVLIQDLEKFLGYDDTTSAVLVGVGHLGRALLAYRGFQHYGLNILTAFDVDPAIINTEFAGKKIFDEFLELKGFTAGRELSLGDFVAQSFNLLYKFVPSYNEESKEIYQTIMTQITSGWLAAVPRCSFTDTNELRGLPDDYMPEPPVSEISKEEYFTRIRDAGQKGKKKSKAKRGGAAVKKMTKKPLQLKLNIAACN